MIALSEPNNTCANLAAALMQVGKNTLAVDCDFRNPALHRYFGSP
jgi:Mrp family chromosome partitioning ATPase